MTLSPQNGFFILLGLLIASSLFLFWKIRGIEQKVGIIFGKKLPKNADADDFQKDLIRRVMRIEADNEQAKSRLQIVEDICKIAVQKVGFLRFNPFPDTGGDNSFVAVLLNGEDDGLLVSSLYTREGVRLYGKRIEKRKSKHLLSQEEKKVLEETINKISNS